MTSGSPTDREVIERCLAGQPDEFRELIERYQGRVYNLLMRILRNSEAAEEMTQEAFLQSYLHLGDYKHQYRFSSWLFKIAQNLAFNQLRKARLSTVSIEGDEAAGGAHQLSDSGIIPRPQAEAEQHELRQILEETFDTLSSKYRAAVVLRHNEGLSYKEISEVLAIPVGTVKFRLHRAYRMLKEKLERREVHLG